MLEIQEKFDTTGYERLIERVGGEKIHITESIERGEVTGFIAYAYREDCTVVYDYDDSGDLMLCDGLVRSVMFKSVLKGIETMIFEIPDGKFGNIRKLRFLGSEGNVCENLDSFMNACESCRKKEAD